MTESKNTPGPWEVFTAVDEPQMGNFYSAIYGPVGDYDGLFIALANQNGNYEADARLIAAAPDLLAALKQIVNSIEVHDDRAVNMALAAISKAEGRQ